MTQAFSGDAKYCASTFNYRNSYTCCTNLCSQTKMNMRPLVRPADVVRAYTSLLKQRRNPGPFNIRLELGRGSYSTILRHLRMLALVPPPKSN